MSLTIIQPEIHIVKETAASQLFRRLLGFEDIFTFFHTQTGEWILGYWINKNGKVADEIEDLGGSFEKMTPQLVNQIRDCWKPVDWKLKKRAILSREQSRINKKIDEARERQDQWDWMKDRTKDKAPVPFAYAPRISGGQ